MHGVDLARGAFEAQRAWFGRYLRAVLDEAQPITEANVAAVEHVLMEAEVDAAKKALRRAGPPGFSAGAPRFAQQVGTTCMSTSLCNGMISMGEAALQLDDDDQLEARVHRVTSDIVDRTSAMGKPGEYRSVDDLFKYLESGRLREVDLGQGQRLERDYRVRLTNSLVDVVEALWTGRARLVIQRRAHAHLAFGLEQEDDGTWWVLMRDPMHGTGVGFSRASLETLRLDYLWSPLKKIPRLMGPHGFQSLTAEALLGHLERYDGMENLGVECPSALVWRAEEAPALHAPPEDDPAAGEKAS
jgi:hypothetical protein